MEYRGGQQRAGARSGGLTNLRREVMEIGKSGVGRKGGGNQIGPDIDFM